MASKQAIATALKGLAANYGTALDPDLPDIWLLGLQDVEDAALMQAMGKVVATDEFFPKLARVRNLLGMNVQPLPDVNGIVERLRGMCDYHPNYGTTLPSVERVRAELGDAIADAYGFIGPKRLEAVVFSGEGVGADIAAREFGEHLQAAQKVGANVTLLPSTARKQLSNASQSVFLDGARPQRIGQHIRGLLATSYADGTANG